MKSHDSQLLESPGALSRKPSLTFNPSSQFLPANDPQGASEIRPKSSVSSQGADSNPLMKMLAQREPVKTSDPGSLNSESVDIMAKQEKKISEANDLLQLLMGKK